MIPPSYNISMKANGHFTQIWQIKNKGEPFDITGWDFDIELKRKRGPTEPIIRRLNAENGGLKIVDAENGKVQIFIGPWPEMKTRTKFAYDLLMHRNGLPYVILEGHVIIYTGATYMGEENND